MLAVEEVLMYIPFASIDNARSIANFVNNLYNKKYKYIDESDYIIEVVAILQRVGKNYNPRLGHISRYAKNTLSLKLRDYVTRKYVPTGELHEDVLSPEVAEKLAEVDLSNYSDDVIQALYNVVTNKARKKDINLINKIFTVEQNAS